MRLRERDLGKAQSGSHQEPFACPACGARLAPWLMGKPVIRSVIWLIGEFIIYIAGIVLLLCFFVLPWWAAMIPPVLLLAICDVTSRAWPLVRVPDR